MMQRNIEMNIFIKNNFFISHLLSVELNFDEIKPAFCVPTSYTYDSFIWFHNCEIQWQNLLLIVL